MTIIVDLNKFEHYRDMCHYIDDLNSQSVLYEYIKLKYKKENNL